MNNENTLKYLKNVNTLTDLYDSMENLDKKQKGDLFETITYYLFKLLPVLNNNLINIWLYKDVPTNILKTMKLPEKDKGIDLLLQNKDGYYAIQCKFRSNPNTCVPWGDLSTFFGLSFGMNNKMKGGFLVTNTYDVCDEVIKSDKVQSIHGEFFDNLPDNFFSNIRLALEEKTISKYVAKESFKYQDECIYDCVDHFIDDDESRGYIEMACGSGKSLTSYWINQQMNVMRSVVFVPSLYLLSQFYSDWVNQSYAEGKKINYLLIGSDADVDDDIKQKLNNGLILHTNPKDIQKYIEKCDGTLVVVCTYQSADKLAEACGQNIKFDFGIFDEAHKTVGQVGKQFSLMLNDDKMTINKRLFMTATPRIYGGNMEDDEVISMDDEEYYGKQIYCYNTGNAIVNKRLVDYQLVTILATNKEMEECIMKNKLVQYKSEFADEESNYLASILIILKKIHDGTCNHLITYHNAVKRAIKFKEFLIKINDILYKDKKVYVESLDGSVNMSKRKKIVRDFVSSKMGILCSARVLNEGVNIPVVDSVCFVDKRDSTIDIVQCVGRALRLCEGKKMASVIIPTFVENIDDEFDKNVYGNIIRILKSMKSTDDGVVEYFTMKSEGKVSGRKICTVERFGVEKKSLAIDLDKWDKEIGEQIWKLVDPFESMYLKVKEWVEKNSKLPSIGSKDIIEKKLGRWCAHKREDKKKRKLYDDKIKKLEEIEGWYWGDDNIKIIKPFDESYNELVLWINKNNKLPSTTSKDFIEKQLGSWSANMRQKKKDGKLDETKINKLETLVHWYWRTEFTKTSKTFTESYNELEKWIKTNSKLPSKNGNTKTEKYLGSWCSRMRRQKKYGKLISKQIIMLEKLNNWYWGTNIINTMKSFEVMYNEVLTWIKTNNKIPTDKSKNLVEKKLGSWCSQRRKNKRHNKLDDDKIKKLEQIEGWYWTKEQTDIKT
jgi:superfamily II DNA or RNA helicase